MGCTLCPLKDKLIHHLLYCKVCYNFTVRPCDEYIQTVTDLAQEEERLNAITSAWPSDERPARCCP